MGKVHEGTKKGQIPNLKLLAKQLVLQAILPLSFGLRRIMQLLIHGLIDNVMNSDRLNQMKKKKKECRITTKL